MKKTLGFGIGKTPDEHSIVCFSVIRDEALLLPFFIDYYRDLGVTHFVFIDNGSIDGSLIILKERTDVCISVYYTTDSYDANEAGLTWVNNLLRTDYKDKTCLVVDVDEFILLRNHLDLSDLRCKMREQGVNACQFLMVDFYPEKVSNSFKYDPFQHSDYYDSVENPSDYFISTELDGSVIVKGGARHRIFDSGPARNDSCCLIKKSFFINNMYSTHYLDRGMHWFLHNDFVSWDEHYGDHDFWDKSKESVSFFSDVLVVAHFKFVKPDLKQFFKMRVDRNEDWGESHEYKDYYNNFITEFYDAIVSRKFSSIDTLYKHTIDRLSDELSRK